MKCISFVGSTFYTKNMEQQKQKLIWYMYISEILFFEKKMLNWTKDAISWRTDCTNWTLKIEIQKDTRFHFSFFTGYLIRNDDILPY
jgi:hypothetical protein